MTLKMKCLLCGGNAELKYKGHPGYKEPDTFDIYYCTDCNTSFSTPRVNAEEIYNIIYNKRNLVPGYDRYWKYMKSVKVLADPLEFLAKSEDVYWSVKEALSFSEKEKKDTKVLEIGSGLGYLTYSLIRAGYDVRGLDLSETAIRQAISTFGDHYIYADLFEYAKSNVGLFDIVVLTEVIEHVNEPVKFLEAIITLLKPGGYTIITTPNKSFFPSDIVWATENPPIHCWWFSEKSFQYLADKNDVSLSFINFKDFHSKYYSAYDLKKYRIVPLATPVLDKNGNLIFKKNTPLNFLRDNLWKMPSLRRILLRLKHSLLKLKRSRKSDIIISDARGYILCAILRKI